MAIILVFGVTLLVVVLISGFAARTVLSTALLFLAAGALTGNGGLNWIDIKPNDPVVVTLADLALFSVLYTDGMRAALPALKATGATAGRALGLGMPLTFIGIALLTKALTPMDWTASFLVGAILSPTDPVFAAAIIGRTDVPLRLRRLLNVESGLNDGLALPVVVVLIAVASHGKTHVWTVVGELAGGIALGIAMPLVAHLLAQLPGIGSESRLAPLGPFSVAVILYATCHLTHANAYLAAFAAGSTLATVTPRAYHAFEEFGDLIAELLKLAALLVFGALLTPQLLHRLPIGAWAVAILALALVRPVALVLSLWRARLSRRETAAVAWFGPKGFASVVYGLLALDAGLDVSQPVFDLVAVCIALSIAVHSSTDVPVARMFDVPEALNPPDAPDASRLE
ncbi:MAG TPA: cation:proton antiporter [Jatrophihabitantaceae bacterium]|nr:cation:proton antiporter [Jatrophihabitantaceae bacterium]